MKARLTAIAALTAVVTFSSVDASAGDFKGKWRNFKDKVNTKVEKLKQHLHDRMNSPEVQGRLAEIRARHRQMARCTPRLS